MTGNPNPPNTFYVQPTTLRLSWADTPSGLLSAPAPSVGTTCRMCRGVGGSSSLA